jgi:hypothetical protein
VKYQWQSGYGDCDWTIKSADFVPECRLSTSSWLVGGWVHGSTQVRNWSQRVAAGARRENLRTSINYVLCMRERGVHGGGWADLMEWAGGAETVTKNKRFSTLCPIILGAMVQWCNGVAVSHTQILNCDSRPGLNCSGEIEAMDGDGS